MPSRLADDHATLMDWLRGAYRDRLRPADGSLAHPYVDPGAAYTGVLWDWDAFFSCVGFAALADEDPAIGRHARGCVDNFVAFQGRDGHAPYSVSVDAGHRPDPDAVRDPASSRNSCKPLLAQFALLTVDRLGGADDAWLAGVRPALERHLEHWFASQGTDLGLSTWRSHRGSGADNHPAYFQRPHDSVVDPFLNAMMVRECRALGEIARRTGGDPDRWRARADDLAAAIDAHCWDPIDGTWYCLDVGRGDPGEVRTPRDWVVPLKFRAWSMVMPLWAGVAAPERARSVVERFVCDRGQLRAAHGIYSLAPCEPAFRIFADFNPSDWCGPVWVVSTYLAFRGLMAYGFVDEAEALASDLCACLARDFRAHGALHEYYHPETGEGLTHPGFVNWNACACLMATELATGTDHTLWSAEPATAATPRAGEDRAGKDGQRGG